MAWNNGEIGDMYWWHQCFKGYHWVPGYILVLSNHLPGFWREILSRLGISQPGKGCSCRGIGRGLGSVIIWCVSSGCIGRWCAVQVCALSMLECAVGGVHSFSQLMQTWQLFIILKQPVHISVTVFSNLTKLTNYLLSLLSKYKQCSLYS